MRDGLDDPSLFNFILTAFLPMDLIERKCQTSPSLLPCVTAARLKFGCRKLFQKLESLDVPKMIREAKLDRVRNLIFRGRTVFETA